MFDPSEKSKSILELGHEMPTDKEITWHKSRGDIWSVPMKTAKYKGHEFFSDSETMIDSGSTNIIMP